MLRTGIRHKRDECIAAARDKSTFHFWDEEMFVAKFKVVDNAFIS